MTQRAWPAWARASEIADLLRLSGPIAISRMAWMLMGLTDAIVLGQVSGQEHELAYVLNSWLPIGVSLGAGMGLLLGVQVLTSEMIGRGEKAQSGRIFRRGLVWSIGLGLALNALVFFGAGILFYWLYVVVNPNATISAIMTPAMFAAETAHVTRILSFSLLGFMISTAASYYLEALRRPMIVTVTNYVGVVVNLVVDLALVLGWWGMPQLGAEGVAYATVGSRWVITLVLMGAVIWLTPAFRPSPPSVPGESKRQIDVGIGTAISNVAEWGGFNLTYSIALFVSVATNAIYGYTVQVMGFCFMFFIGVASATSVRVAEQVGRGNIKGVREASRLGVAATFVLGAIMASIVFLFQDQIALLLVNAQASIDGVLLAPAIAALLIYAAIGTTFDGLQVVASMALRAQGTVWRPTMIHIGSFFVVMIPAGYLLGVVAQRGAQGMMEAALIGIGLAGVLQWGLLEWKTARHPR